MKKNRIEDARSMVGPAFEELTETAMMEIDGEGTAIISAITVFVSIMLWPKKVY